MAKRRGRSRKPGARTKNGRLSRAYQGEARDAGTPELQAKKLAAVNGAADPRLSASAASILLAHGVIDRDQHTAAEHYHAAYRRSFGLPDYGHCLLGDDARAPSMTDEALERARRQLDAMAAKLTPAQKLAIDNVVISNWLPAWLYADKLGWRAMPEDAHDKAALLAGLDALVKWKKGARLQGERPSGWPGRSVSNQRGLPSEPSVRHAAPG